MSITFADTTHTLAGRVFLDTSYVLASFNPADSAHGRAVALRDCMITAKTQLVTTRLVLVEIGDALSRIRPREAVTEILLSLHNNPRLQIVPASDALYDRAFALYVTHSDQTWGMTDCLSFVVMRTFGLVDALTTDRHFTQAGFRALLRPET